MEQQPRFEEMAVVGDKKKRRQGGWKNRTIRPIIVRLDAVSNGCIVARSFESVCPNHNRGKNVEYVDRTETRFFRQLVRFPNVERFLKRF